ncbi:MAG TPA: hypothetical protein VKS60_16585 [Stellaceae bacterium]|nr:hypothetical protein [Stellaceae bacterium]
MLSTEINQGLAKIIAVTPSTSVFVYTPGNLSNPGAGTRFGRVPTVHAAPGAINVEQGAPTQAGQQITLQGKAQGIVLTGSTSARLVGHVANQFGSVELLVGNEGSDTIGGGGGSGTIISGSGTNKIHAGSGDMVVYSHGSADTIKGGAGIDNVDAFGSATVTAGSGLLVFTDSGTASSHFLVEGASSGAMVAYSGLGSDTFVGGSGTSTSYMQDSGQGGVTFEIGAPGAGGFDLISGFDSNAGNLDTLSGAFFTHLARFDTAGGGNSKVTVVGGSAYIHLGNTEVVFVGVNSVSTIIGT